MKIDTYPVIIGINSLVYEFTSHGKNGKIKKLVIYTATDIPNLYNLGFGDKNEITGDIDDLIVSDNGDSEKVLATVAGTLYSFTDKHPAAIIFASGSTEARNRLYRIGISKYFHLISPDFEIFGLTKEMNWVLFEKKKEFIAFSAKRKKN